MWCSTRLPRAATAFVDFAKEMVDRRQAPWALQSKQASKGLIYKRQAAIKMIVIQPPQHLAAARLAELWPRPLAKPLGSAARLPPRGAARLDAPAARRLDRARLEETVADADGPVVLVAHSLGCILTAWWAAHTRHARQVRGALLVAPGDMERPDLRRTDPRLGTHRAASRCRSPRCWWAAATTRIAAWSAREALAQAWGARFVDYGDVGHFNADSWPGRLGRRPWLAAAIAA